MTYKSDPLREVVYELTVSGALGEVLRAATAPHEVARSGIYTILGADVRAGADLLDLMILLQRRGICVEHIYRVPGGAAVGEAAHPSGMRTATTAGRDTASMAATSTDLHGPAEPRFRTRMPAEGSVAPADPPMQTTQEE